MPVIQPIIRAEIDPAKPVPEICAIISTVTTYHPGREEAILQGIKKALDERLAKIKEEAKKHAG